MVCVLYVHVHIYIYIYLERDLYLCVVAMGDGFNHVTAYSCLPPYLKGYITQGPTLLHTYVEGENPKTTKIFHVKS